MTKRIDAGAAYTDIVPESTPFPTILSETDYSPTRAQIVDGAVANKPAVRTVGVTNVNLATDVDNGKTLGGHVLQTGDLFSLKGQTNGAENGPWITSASGAPVRPAWADTGYTLALKTGDTIRCTDGDFRGSVWRLVTAGTINIDTTAQLWVNDTFYLHSNMKANEDVAFNSVHYNGQNNAISVWNAFAYFIPAIWPCSDLGPDEFRLIVSTEGVAARIVVALYDADDNWNPTNRLMRDDTILGDTVGEKSVLFTRLSNWYPGKKYYAGIFTDVDITVRALNIGITIYPGKTAGTASYQGSGFIVTGRTFENCFPDPFSGSTTPIDQNIMPGFWLYV